MKTPAAIMYNLLGEDEVISFLVINLKNFIHECDSSSFAVFLVLVGSGIVNQILCYMKNFMFSGGTWFQNGSSTDSKGTGDSRGYCSLV